MTDDRFSRAQRRFAWILAGLLAALTLAAVLQWPRTPHRPFLLEFQNHSRSAVEVEIFQGHPVYPYVGDTVLTLPPLTSRRLEMKGDPGSRTVWAWRQRRSKPPGRERIDLRSPAPAETTGEVRDVLRFDDGLRGTAVGTMERFIDDRPRYGDMNTRIARLLREELLYLAGFLGPNDSPRVHEIVTDGGMAAHLIERGFIVLSGDTHGGSLNTTPAELSPALVRGPSWDLFVAAVHRAAPEPAR